MSTLSAKWKRLRRLMAAAMRRWAGRVDPGWPLPAQYTARHVMEYHELLIDVGLADAYDAMVGGDGAPASDPSQTAAPPPGARDGTSPKRDAAEALHQARQQAQNGNGITTQQAQAIRRAFAGELGRLNMIVLDVGEDEAETVPVDVTIKALMHFVPVYAAATSALTGTESATTSA